MRRAGGARFMHHRENQARLPVGGGAPPPPPPPHGTIPLTVQAMRAGAVEFLTKPFDEAQLLAVLDAARARALVQGRKWLQARQVKEKYQRLTQRERQVFSLVVDGLSHKQIARHIGTSEVTTKVHKKNIMNKMQSRSLVELVAMHNLIEARAEGQGAA